MKYTGKLNVLIGQKRIGLLEGPDAYKVEAQRIHEEMLSKLPDLFSVHRVEPNNWPALAFALAREHVPGFKIKRPPGRKTEWGISDKAGFRLDVDTLIANSGNTLPVTEAIKLACRLDEWASKTKPMTLAAITQHYYTADLRFVAVVRDARAWKALPSALKNE
jgi:hypothetical protein